MAKCEKCRKFMKIDERAECAGWQDEDGEWHEAWLCANCSNWQPEISDEEIRQRYEAESRAMEADMEAMRREFAELPEPVYAARDFEPLADDDIPW
jgi:hypothetical protein